jgi:hypothetical protein
MKKISYLGCLVVALVLAVCGGRVAMADDFSLTFNSVGGGSLGGEYVYPYNFTITKGSATWTAQLMCVDFNDQVSFGESWKATEESAAVAGKKFEEAAWLLNWGVGHGDVADANWAVWELFETVPGGSPDEGGLLALLAGLTPSQLAAFGNWQVFIPDPDNGLGGGGPQFFLGGPESVTPEPGALLLLGSGIFFLAMLIHFRKRTQRLPSLTI